MTNITMPDSGRKQELLNMQSMLAASQLEVQRLRSEIGSLKRINAALKNRLDLLLRRAMAQIMARKIAV